MVKEEKLNHRGVSLLLGEDLDKLPSSRFKVEEYPPSGSARAELVISLSGEDNPRFFVIQLAELPNYHKLIAEGGKFLGP